VSPRPAAADTGRPGINSVVDTVPIQISNDLAKSI